MERIEGVAPAAAAAVALVALSGAGARDEGRYRSEVATEPEGGAAGGAEG